jgi:hypothetical protein
VSSQLHVPATSLPGKESRYPLDRRLGGPQSWSGYRGEKIPSPCWDLNPDHPARSPVKCYTTELSRLLAMPVFQSNAFRRSIYLTYNLLRPSRSAAGLYNHTDLETCNSGQESSSRVISVLWNVSHRKSSTYIVCFTIFCISCTGYLSSD